MSITLTRHCIEQAEAKGVPLDAIRAVLAAPECDIPSTRKTPTGREPYTCRRCGTPQRKLMGRLGDLRVCVVVNTCCGVAITCWVDGIDTELRADQRAAGVTYRGHDGRLHR